MKKEQLLELLKNEEFAKSLCQAKNEEEALEVFRTQGIEINSVEEIKTLLEPSEGELSIKELEAVNGGFEICVGIGLGGPNLCVYKGIGETKPNGDDEYDTGVGVSLCYFLGVGGGIVV